MIILWSWWRNNEGKDVGVNSVPEFAIQQTEARQSSTHKIALLTKGRRGTNEDGEVSVVAIGTFGARNNLWLSWRKASVMARAPVLRIREILMFIFDIGVEKL